MQTLELWHQAGSIFDFGGHSIYYQRAGHGPKLVLIHGFPTASWDWHKIWSALVARFDVLAFDLLGFGFSAKPPQHTYSMAKQADLVESLTQHLGFDACHVLAHDYGDTVVQELLARQQEGQGKLQMHSVTLLNGGIFFDAAKPRPIQKLLRSPIGGLVAALLNERRFRTSFCKVFAPATQPTQEELAQYWQLVSHDDGHRIAHRLSRYLDERTRYMDRWRSAIVESPAPLQFVAGDVDPVSGQSMIDRYRELLPKGQLMVLHGVGHYPQLEAPRATLQALFRFIEGAG